MRLFSNVIKSLMKDASEVASGVSPGESEQDLRERIHLLGHYVDYTLRYCEECPWLTGERVERPLKAVDPPTFAQGNLN